MAVPDWGASFTVYQPGFVITARELKWRLRNGNPKGRMGNIENGTEREQIWNIKNKLKDPDFQRNTKQNKMPLSPTDEMDREKGNSKSSYVTCLTANLPVSLSCTDSAKILKISSSGCTQLPTEIMLKKALLT